MKKIIEILALIVFIVIGGTIILGNPFSPPSPSPQDIRQDIQLVEAKYYQKLAKQKVQCQLCFRNCIIPEGERGFCRVRENRKGTLYTLVYGRVASWQVMPVEKDTIYHFLPQAWVFAVATASCNFRCKQCHNWVLTQRGPEEVASINWSPQEVVEHAIRLNCPIISCTVNEPTVFYEYMLDIFKIAKERGLHTQFRSNGALRPEPLRELLKYTDVVSLDLKGFTEEFYHGTLEGQLDPVLETLKILKEAGVWFEITNLIIPTLNDNMEDVRKLSVWVRDNLGKDVPLHFNRFFPAYKLTKLPPTPIETLEKAKKVAKEVGLNYVYVGNVPGHQFNKTFCPQCERVVVERVHFMVLAIHIEDGKCKFCRHPIPGVWVK